MWFDGQRQPNTVYVANTSRGKDSTAMLRAIQLMGWPLDMICSVDIWFDDETPAELPPMVKFKDEYDRKVYDWFGVHVTRLCALKRERDCPTPSCSTSSEGAGTDLAPRGVGPCNGIRGATGSKQKLTYVDIFYRQISPKRERERERHSGSFNGRGGNFRIYGFPFQNGAWCNSDLKRSALSVSQVKCAAGARANSRPPHDLRFPNAIGSVVP